MNSTAIIRAYTDGTLTMDEANAKLAAIGSNVRLAAGKHALTEQEIAQTKVGKTPKDANGWGLLDTGTGGYHEKVHVVNGVTVDFDKGADTNYALVIIGGKMYEIVDHNKLADM